MSKWRLKQFYGTAWATDMIETDGDTAYIFYAEKK